MIDWWDVIGNVVLNVVWCEKEMYLYYKCDLYYIFI